jgi:hypothetical protein
VTVVEALHMSSGTEVIEIRTAVVARVGVRAVIALWG